uniref:Uncharacterized protein n=1 Tax=Ixodes ricinus TaxID=34613 RepID=A0A6B0U3H8_IXORI
MCKLRNLCLQLNLVLLVSRVNNWNLVVGTPYHIKKLPYFPVYKSLFILRNFYWCVLRNSVTYMLFFYKYGP